MELGRIPEIDQHQVNAIKQQSKIEKSNKSAKIIPDEEYKKNSTIDYGDLKGVILSNVRFGYDFESRDFYVKVIKDGGEYQYPTKEMMEIKANMNQHININR